MTKKKIGKLILFLSLAFLLLCTVLICGCDFASLFKKTLQSPTLNLNNLEQTISWATVTNAETYDVYINNKYKTNIEDATTASNKYNVFNFGEYITEDVNIYKIYIIAKAEGYNNSAKSNTITYLSNNDATLVNSVKVNNSLAPVTGLTVTDDKVLLWDELGSISEYYVMIYDNKNGAQFLSTEHNGFNFTDYVVQNEILAFRVGIKNSLDEVCFSDTVFYNDAINSVNYGTDPENFKNLFNTIYLFKGNYFDAYLTSQEEMNQMMYYMFVNRVEQQELAISTTYYSQLVNKYGRNNFAYLIGNSRSLGGIGEGTSSFTETCDYSLSFYEDSDVPARHFHVGFEFKYINGTNNQPTLSMGKELTQSNLDVGYYDRVTYTKRASNYDNFASDKQYLTEYVTTSEQLYFAVENKITPLFKTENCTAYKIYQKAKNVLKQIVSDEMTDYEKVLSIFDWICINSVYDNAIVAYNSDDVSFTNYTSFSLEGVLNDGLAVCDGYSKTFALLCNMEGIDCYRFSGGIDSNGNGSIDSNEGLHAWNKVKIAGGWYVVDITWSVITTNANDFDTDIEGAAQYKSNEFVNHMYFLVSDEDIVDHIASDTELNEKLLAPNRYYFYLNQTYDGVNNLIMESQEDLSNLVAWMLENKIYSMDIVFDYGVFGLYTMDYNYPAIQSAIGYAKRQNGIEQANIMYPSMLLQNIIYESYGKKGLIYNISIINLDKVTA